MITEDYVSFETAKLLKEKGFEGKMHTFYTEKGTEMESAYVVPSNFFPIYRPTLQMAMKWLREKYNINPVPYALSLGWAFDVFDLSNRDITGCKKLYSMDFPSKSEAYSTYEDACEAGIKYCLENLI